MLVFEVRRRDTNVLAWYRPSKFWRSALISFWVSLGSLWSIYAILNYFKVKLPWSLGTSLPFFIAASIVVAMARIIVTLSNNLATAIQSRQPVPMHNDSIIDMMKDAESNSRWGEIIKLGTALSEALWYTSRKRLRVDVGHFLEVAARQTNNHEILARTLIDDLGNTIMGLGDVNQGISYIKQGIKIAEENGLHYLIARGYRNLANCYSFKGDTASARRALANASAAAQQIPSQREQLDAIGAIKYAESKIAYTDGKYQEAIDQLNSAIQIYSDLAKQFPETSDANKDRLVKIHREKGVIYLKMGAPDSQDKAYASCQVGLQLAQVSQNYDEIVRCCCLMASILLDKDAVPTAEGMMNIASNNIARIDTPSIIDEYNRVSRRLINASQSTS